MQQYRGLSSKLRSNNKSSTPQPHRQIILDLKAWLEHLITEGHHIILSMDSNESLTSTGNFTPLTYNPDIVTSCPHHDGKLSTLAKTCGLVDILQTHHTGEAPPTYNRGKKRLDYILISANISQAVLRSGILPFYSLFLSDHRPCYIDIDSNLLFNEATSQAPSDHRGLQLQDPRKVEQYIAAVNDQLIYHNVMEKVRGLKSRAEGNAWGPSDQATYEQLDALTTEIMKHAEKLISRKYTKKIEWSPALAKAVNTTRYWRLLLKRSRNLLVSNVILCNTRRKAGIPASDTNMTRQEIIENLREAIKDLKTKQSNHVQLRKQYLEELVEYLVLKRGNIDPLDTEKLNKAKAKQVQALINRERKKRMYRKINYTLSDQNDNRGRLCRINVPASIPLEPYPVGPDPKTWDGPWVAITDPWLIAKYVCAQNVRQYNQAANTPFGSGYLGKCVGQTALTEAAEAILNGSFRPDTSEDLLPETMDILNTSGSPLPIQQNSTTSSISPEEFSNTYRIVKETTSSSPSGRHVGHYKAATKDPILTELHSTMMSLPYMVGFSPERWRQVTDIMLEKTPGAPDIHRLRIIALMESDYNQKKK
jgi:hypothetical protein